MTDRTVLVDHTPSGGLRAALLIDRRLMALEMDHPSNPTRIGRIMGAKAIRAVPNMGILLRLADGAEMFLQGRMEMPAPGQNVTVQVIRDGRGAKLGLATTEISRTGRALVHLPGGNRVAFSRRLDIPAERRQALENLLSTMPGGWIVRRTAAQLGDWPVEQEAKGLIREAAEPRQSGSAAPNAFRRLMCDHGTPGPIQIQSCGRVAHRIVEDWCTAFAPDLLGRLDRLDAGSSLFAAFDLESELEQLRHSRVPLPEGGSLLIEPTAALTAIDVNAGAAANALSVNLCAAREIARQIVLRHIGGIVVIDFISMTRSRDRDRTTEALRLAVAEDPSQVDILPMSAFGLVEMTRERRGPELTLPLEFNA